MTFLGVAAAIGLLDGVMEQDDLAAYDPAVTAAAVSWRSPVLTALARLLTALGSAAALVPFTLLVLAGLLVRRRRLAATVVAVGMSMSLLLTIGLKGFVGRERPPAVDVLGPDSSGYAFPSGHTLNSTVFFGLVAGLLLLRVQRAWARALVIGGYVVTTLGVGLSRVYLGYHWLTDVMAGWSIGSGVLGVLAVGALLVNLPTRSSGESRR